MLTNSDQTSNLSGGLAGLKFAKDIPRVLIVYGEVSAECQNQLKIDEAAPCVEK